MCREVFMEGRQPFKEAPPPGPGASPFAERADALVADVSSPKLRLWGALWDLRDLHAQRERAIPNLAGDVQRLWVHRKVLADGSVVAAVLGELAQHARMRVGLFSNTAWSGNSMHVSVVLSDPLMLTPIHYSATPRVASARGGCGGF